MNIGNKLDFKLSTPEEIGLEIGYRLRQQRMSKHWTQQELADRTGLDVGSIGTWENLRMMVLICFLSIHQKL